ncbi:MAG: methyltransferase domain-containing protein [Candidatus Dormibacteraeota bacterium]|nr:methyltransferase domain-containing protein [Candidatus Dormibacteraeota bacterium]
MDFDIKDIYTSTVGDALAELSTSCGPLSLDILYDLATECGVGSGSLVLDVGCANGGNSRKLLSRTDCTIRGVEFLDQLVELGRRENAATDIAEDRFSISQGTILDIQFPNEHFDFVFCRDVLTDIQPLPDAIAECCRILKPGGYMLVYMTLATPRLSSAERTELFPPLGVNTADQDYAESCFEDKFTITRRIVIGGQGRQHMEESGDHETTEGLVKASRLRTWPERFVEKYGERTYAILLAECLYGVYQLLGKLQPTIYILSK